MISLISTLLRLSERSESSRSRTCKCVWPVSHAVHYASTVDVMNRPRQWCWPCYLQHLRNNLFHRLGVVGAPNALVAVSARAAMADRRLAVREQSITRSQHNLAHQRSHTWPA